MKTSHYNHQHAGFVIVIQGISAKEDGCCEPCKLHLYKVGDTIHIIQPDGNPGGAVEISECDEAVQGWGVSDPIKVNGVIVSKADLSALEK